MVSYMIAGLFVLVHAQWSVSRSVDHVHPLTSVLVITPTVSLDDAPVLLDM